MKVYCKACEESIERAKVGILYDYEGRDDIGICKDCYNSVILSEYSDRKTGLTLGHLMWLEDHLDDQRSFMNEELENNKQNKKYCAALRYNIKITNSILKTIRPYADVT